MIVKCILSWTSSAKSLALFMGIYSIWIINVCEVAHSLLYLSQPTYLSVMTWAATSHSAVVHVITNEKSSSTVKFAVLSKFNKDSKVRTTEGQNIKVIRLCATFMNFEWFHTILNRRGITKSAGFALILP